MVIYSPVSIYGSDVLGRLVIEHLVRNFLINALVNEGPFQIFFFLLLLLRRRAVRVRGRARRRVLIDGSMTVPPQSFFRVLLISLGVLLISLGVFVAKPPISFTLFRFPQAAWGFLKSAQLNEVMGRFSTSPAFLTFNPAGLLEPIENVPYTLLR